MSKSVSSTKLQCAKALEKSTRHFVETYHSEEVINKVIDEHKSSILHYAYIFHDKDVKEDGSPKVPHFHIVFKLTSTRTLKSVQGWFDKYSGANTRNPEVCASIGLSYAYLMHKFNPEKVSYPPSLIKTDDRAYFEVAMATAEKRLNYGDVEQEDGIVKMFYDLVGGFTTLEMIDKWGKTFIVNSRSLYPLVDRARLESGLELKSDIYSYKVAKLESEVLDLEVKKSKLQNLINSLEGIVK